MTFVRRLAAVLMVVAVIVAGGVAWERAAGAGAGDRTGRSAETGRGPIRADLPTGEDAGLRAAIAEPQHRTRPVEYQNLVRTALVEFLIMAVVVGFSRARYRRRRIR